MNPPSRPLNGHITQRRAMTTSYTLEAPGDPLASNSRDIRRSASAPTPPKYDLTATIWHSELSVSIFLLQSRMWSAPSVYRMTFSMELVPWLSAASILKGGMMLYTENGYRKTLSYWPYFWTPSDLGEYPKRYNRVKELGRGRFGVVYQVKDAESGDEFAAKHIKWVNYKALESFCNFFDVG